MAFSLTTLGSFQPAWLCVRDIRGADGTEIQHTGDCGDNFTPPPYEQEQWITLPREVPVGHTILVIAQFEIPLGQRPGFNGNPNQSVTDSQGGLWVRDTLPVAGPRVYERWRTIVTGAPLHTGARIRLQGCRVAWALEANGPLLLLTYQQQAIPPATVAEDRRRLYFNAQQTDRSPVLLFAHWAAFRDGGFIVNYPWPEANFTPDFPAGISPAGSVVGDFAERTRVHSGPNLSDPVIHDVTEHHHFQIWAAFKVLTTEGLYTAGGMEIGHPVQPGEPGGSSIPPGYHYQVQPTNLGIYTVPPERLWPHNLYIRSTGYYFRADASFTGNIWVRRSRNGSRPFDSQVQVTALDAGDVRPVLWWEAARDRLWCIWERTGGGVFQSHSDDDGVTWTEAELVMADARLPYGANSEPDGSGNELRAWYSGGFIRGSFKPAGETPRAPVTFTDEVGSALAVEEDTFSFVFEGDDQARLVLTAHILGEAEASEWLCTDGGEYLRFQRLAG